MDLEEAKVVLESILFVADEPVSISQLADTLQVKRSLVKKAARSLADDYLARGLRVQFEGEKVQMVTAPDTAPFVERFLGLQHSGALSAAALETLAIVAYQQPITRPEIEDIRGVNCQGVLKNLMARGLIEAVDRLDTVGRPIVYGTTFEFLQYFGLANLAELPKLEEPELADEG
ncbi:MAG: SMC-Scp complex subunit ScpB [Anaerolineae bacterium]|nr:SMC-Scp complex subunit ScpB [Anaerolineae bacterium]NIN95272.1 SMC-Scp complex subunit ScpB [Anaerolineae bacterium]NIQ78237.1 SMC-Scp complex subunit ScpB [Anaerolineae bacterium]